MYLRQYEDAKQSLEIMFTDYPERHAAEDSVKVYYDILSYQQNWEAAANCASSIIDDAGKSQGARAHTLAMLGFAAWRQGKESESLNYLNRVGTEYPEYDAEAVYYKFLIALCACRFDEATGYQRELDAKNHAWGLLALGRILHAQKEYAKAAGCFREAADKAGIAKDNERLGQALIYLYNTQAFTGDSVGGEKAKRELAAKAPLFFRKRFPMTDAEFDAYLKQPAAK